MAAILLTGDVMLGRGIDQILACPTSPELFEPFVASALDYVALAEAKSGPIPRCVPFDYVWGDALADLANADCRIINLETALTCWNEPAPKGINYRCHPANLPCLTAATIDCCVLANNHVLDWGVEGLLDTLDSLDTVGLKHAGAGRDLAEAEAPAILALAGDRRMLVYALGSPAAVPHSWAAGLDRPGVSLLDDHDAALDRLATRIAVEKQPSDIAIASIHWGDNWGYDVPSEQQWFARRLVDEALIDIVHCHSSHHPKAIELYRGKPIFYGCGDFLNDYEGIRGEEVYRPDLVLAYRIGIDEAGRLTALDMLPFRIRKFRLQRTAQEEALWLAMTMDRECRRFGEQVWLEGDALHLTTMAPA